MKLRTVLITLFLLSIAVLAAAQQQKPARTPLLPDSFAGWQRVGASKVITNAAAVDPAQPAALKEYGFKDAEEASYTKEDRKLTVKAARFDDASGAYGAFTFYREPKMRVEQVGTMAASLNERVVFFRDNVVVQANFDRVTAMSAAELRELAAGLPGISGPASKLPSLPQYLPRENVIPNSAKFLVGPAAYQALSLPIAQETIDFSRSPEVLTAQMQTHDGWGQALLISYPTPQIAIDREKAFQTADPHQGPTYLTKRSGPMVAVVYGTISQSDAKSLLSQVNYEADVTWNENTGLSKRDNIGTIVVAALTMAGIIFVFSVGAGAIIGFSKMWLRKILPARYAPQTDEAAFIRLHLEDESQTAATKGVDSKV